MRVTESVYILSLTASNRCFFFSYYQSKTFICFPFICLFKQKINFPHSQRLPKMLQDSLEFDSELQELYVSICDARNTRKRKRSPEYGSASVDSFVPDQDQTSCVPTGYCISIHPRHIYVSKCMHTAFILSTSIIFV